MTAAVGDEESVIGSASRGVAAYIRNAILEGALAPGEKIRQESIAQATGTSRAPVREALRVLETEGLVTLVPNSGATVARLDHDEFEELYRIRESLEPQLLASSIPHLGSADIDHLHDLLVELEATDIAVTDFVDLDRQFHLGAYVPSARPRTFDLVRGFWNLTQQYRRKHVSQLSEAERRDINMEHRLILSAIVAGDAEGAAERLRLHIRRTRLTLSTLDEFDD